ncbi:VWA domain-containing protein [Allorhizobium pseudoryzae]|uniref:vWA domain-containing protein n=1 Tax=Allorhizobium pseudoryzae TaxID=379684 RepID=UPI0013EC2D91|nr:TadE/TadG family type IV pilus assembly protein [Allorhizobium pseudoryzae]
MISFSLPRLIKDRGGNFGMMTALLLPLSIGVGGMAIDLTNVMQQKSDLQSMADAATLAAAAKLSTTDAMTEEQAEEMAKDYLIGQKLQELEQQGLTKEQLAEAKAELLKSTEAEATITSTGGSSKAFVVKMNSTYAIQLNPLTQMLGFKTVPVSIASVANSAREGNALSMYLVLDRSGSMAWDTTTVDPVSPTKTVTQDAYGYYACTDWRGRPATCYGWYTETKTVTNYVTKIAALKAAASVMFTELLKASAPDVASANLQQEEAKKLIRVGAVSYTHQTQKEEPPAWGTTKASDYVQALPEQPTGGTDATGALDIAFAAFKSANGNEAAQHKTKGNDNFGRFIVLMTDGEMTGNSANWNQALDTKVRAQCQTAKDDKITVFTVAFMAPDRGKSLLKACASGEENYYESNDMTELVKAFGDIGRKAAKTAVRLTN